ncbi:hypothetical protein [Streptomyces brevispora]|uniref:MmgE/PrpD family protein n=1 Tax=Streptomyces brevispora TaxID=887462 RepID=A0A561TU80_9ACTN|nr:hypothetical protein [Streptomyces brevispora]TWF90657.1 MmgE/PrpD family protein [Streptomyces brevispora]
MPGIFFKPYPANHFTHTAADAAMALREQGLDPARVERLVLGVPAPVIRTIGQPIERKRAPETGYQAQFSGPYMVAAGLLGGGRGLGLGLDDFTDELARDPARRELMAKVEVVADDTATGIFPEQFPAVLTAHDIDGRVWRQEVLSNRGGPDRPLSDAELALPFRDNAVGRLSGTDIDLVMDRGLNLGALDRIQDLLRPLAELKTVEEAIMAEYDLVVKNVRVVTDEQDEPQAADIAVLDGKIAAVAPGIDATGAARVVDGEGKLAFPGVVDAHQHWGIYNPLDQDAESESRACAQGGVTSALSYMRTGQYDLDKGGAYADFFPGVLELTEGRAHVDYAYHLAPMSKGHIAEIPALVGEHGVTSFKVFMFYGSHGLHGRSADQSSFLMTPEGERYDYAHFEFVRRSRPVRRHGDRTGPGSAGVAVAQNPTRAGLRGRPTGPAAGPGEHGLPRPRRPAPVHRRAQTPGLRRPPELHPPHANPGRQRRVHPGRCRAGAGPRTDRTVREGQLGRGRGRLRPHDRRGGGTRRPPRPGRGPRKPLST